MRNYVLILFLLLFSATSPSLSKKQITYNQSALAQTLTIDTFKTSEAYSQDTLEAFLQVIRYKESSNNYNAKGAKGEIGAYQFMPKMWKKLCVRYYGKVLLPTKENQDAIAYRYAKELLSKHTASEAASTWNCGKPKPSKKNKFTPKYVKHFNKLFRDTLYTQYQKYNSVKTYLKTPLLNV